CHPSGKGEGFLHKSPLDTDQGGQNQNTNNGPICPIHARGNSGCSRWRILADGPGIRYPKMPPVVTHGSKGRTCALTLKRSSICALIAMASARSSFGPI